MRVLNSQKKAEVKNYTVESWLLISFLIIYPLAVLPLDIQGEIVFLYGKTIFLALWLAIAVSIFRISIVQDIRRRLSSKNRYNDLLLFSGLIYLLLAQLLNGQGFFYTGFRLEGAVTTFATILIYIIFRTASRYSQEKIIHSWPYFIFPVVVVAIIQYLYPESFISQILSTPAFPGSTFGNRAALSAFIIMLIPWGIYWLSIKRKWIYAIVFIFLGLVLAMAQTRAALIGGFLSIIILNFILIKRRRKLILPFAFLSFFLTIFGILLGLSIPDKNREEHFRSADSGRMVLWPIALKAIQERPVIGWGTGGYKTAFDNFAEWETDRATRDYLTSISTNPLITFKLDQNKDGIFVTKTTKMDKVSFSVRQQTVNDKAHNEYLDQAVQYGVPYLLINVVWHFLILRKNYKNGERKIVLSGGIISLLIFNLFWMNSITFIPIYYALLGIVDNDNDVQSYS